MEMPGRCVSLKIQFISRLSQNSSQEDEVQLLEPYVSDSQRSRSRILSPNKSTLRTGRNAPPKDSLGRSPSLTFSQESRKGRSPVKNIRSAVSSRSNLRLTPKKSATSSQRSNGPNVPTASDGSAQKTRLSQENSQKSSQSIAPNLKLTPKRSFTSSQKSSQEFPASNSKSRRGLTKLLEEADLKSMEVSKHTDSGGSPLVSVPVVALTRVEEVSSSPSYRVSDSQTAPVARSVRAFKDETSLVDLLPKKSSQPVAESETSEVTFPHQRNKSLAVSQGENRETSQFRNQRTGLQSSGRSLESETSEVVLQLKPRNSFPLESETSEVTFNLRKSQGNDTDTNHEESDQQSITNTVLSPNSRKLRQKAIPQTSPLPRSLRRQPSREASPGPTRHNVLCGSPIACSPTVSLQRLRDEEIDSQRVGRSSVLSGTPISYSPTVSLRRLNEETIDSHLGSPCSHKQMTRKKTEPSTSSDSQLHVITKGQSTPSGDRDKTLSEVPSVRRETRSSRTDAPRVKRRLDTTDSAEFSSEAKRGPTSTSSSADSSNTTDFKKPSDVETLSNSGTAKSSGGARKCNKPVEINRDHNAVQSPRSLRRSPGDSGDFEKPKKTPSSTKPKRLIQAGVVSPVESPKPVGLLAEWGMLPISMRLQQKLLEESERDAGGATGSLLSGTATSKGYWTPSVGSKAPVKARTPKSAPPRIFSRRVSFVCSCMQTKCCL